MKNRQVAVLDYGIGNVKSITNALEMVGASPLLTADRSKVMEADVLILPGVGAFGQGMANLNERHLIPVIHDFVKTKRPFIGICLGMQMLFDESEEFGITQGLGLVGGRVRRMSVANDGNERLPHVGWNEIVPSESSSVSKFWEETPAGTSVYFVHSFVGVPDSKVDILASANYGGADFCAAVQKENICGVQFHPEKSGSLGLKMLKFLVNQSF